MAETTSTMTDRLDGTRERIAGTTKDIKSAITDRAKRTATATSGSVASTMRQPRRAMGRLGENPLGIAIGAVAVGFLAGTLAPPSRLEDETVGSAADELKAGLEEAGHEAIDRGRDLVSETIEEFKDGFTQNGSPSSTT